MIRIVKRTEIPSKLSENGRAENARNCALYDANPAAYISGTASFKIKRTIYGHRTVKNALLTAQHKKCCFCEKKQRDEPGAVEHFRPKNGYKSARQEKELKKPGYYWLAYEWSNLFFVCHTCNSCYKINLFPLRSAANRAKSHHDDIMLESPLILDPGGRKNPRKHIVFENNLPRGLSAIGRETILVCGLDRSELNEDRKEWLMELKDRILLLLDQPNLQPSIKQRTIKYLKEAQKPHRKYSAAAIDYIRQYPTIIKLLAS